MSTTTKSTEKFIVVKTGEFCSVKRPRPGKRDELVALLQAKGATIVAEVKTVPGLKTLEKYSEDGISAVPGCSCRVEPDGQCKHGRPSWMIVLGVI